MPRLHRHPAQIGQLHALLDPLEAEVLARGLPRDTALRLRLLAEELFTNSVLHGCGQQTGGCVAWGLKQHLETLELRYLDNGVVWLPPGTRAAAPEQAGGHGLPLLEALSCRLARRRLQGWNVVHVHLLLRNSSCLPNLP